MAGHPHYGWGAFPPPPHGYPPGPPHIYPPGPPHMYPPGIYYPPYIHPGADPVQVVDESEAIPELPGETVELSWSTYRWVPACLNQGSIPPGALRVGTDADGDEIYAGRAPHEGEIVPAKVIPNKNVCFISFCGEEILKDQFEVLVPTFFAWQFASNGELPPGAVNFGVTADGERLYYGRVTRDGLTTPGKIQPSHGCCYFPLDGGEQSSTEYECLVLI